MAHPSHVGSQGLLETDVGILWIDAGELDVQSTRWLDVRLWSGSVFLSFKWGFVRRLNGVSPI